MCHLGLYPHATFLLFPEPLLLCRKLSLLCCRCVIARRSKQTADSRSNTLNGTSLMPRCMLFLPDRYRLWLWTGWSICPFRMLPLLVLLLVLLLKPAVALHLLLNGGETELAVNLRARENMTVLEKLHALNSASRLAVLEIRLNAML